MPFKTPLADADKLQFAITVETQRFGDLKKLIPPLGSCATTTERSFFPSKNFFRLCSLEFDSAKQYGMKSVSHKSFIKASFIG